MVQTWQLGKIKLEVVVSDITTLEVDAIVNAANSSLAGGGGVDGAIHRAAGPELKAECLQLGGCKTGQAKITKGYSLPAKHVIHAVGPIWRDGNQNEPEDLANAYQNSLILAKQHNLKSIAFPAISTGIYGFPKELAAKIAVTKSIEFLETESHEINHLIFCCFDEDSATYLINEVKILFNSR